ncbi:MAG: hypothetical protein IH608_07165 [Proteobacteria bacterium]|nr:hypothetical protein [Pseudomonadota bacterium]
MGRVPGFCAGIVVVAWAMMACALGGRPDAPAQGPRSDKDSVQLIAEAVQRGDIDGDTATLYRVYAVVDDRKLPPEYRSTVPLRDGTPILRDARSRYEALRPEVREKLDPYLFPRGKP